MTAPLPPALDYLIGQIETTAEQCQGGDGSNNALRKNGRGEGLWIAKSMIVKAWPAILAQVDLPSAVEAEALRAALRAIMPMADRRGFGAHASCGPGECSDCTPLFDADALLSNPAQPSDLWAGLRSLLDDWRRWAAEARKTAGAADHEPLPRVSPAELRAEDNALGIAETGLRELLGLPPKEDH